jgi:hypothetical protein
MRAVKRALKCLRRICCEHNTLPPDVRDQLYIAYTIGGVILFLLLGVVWSRLPGVASFTQITGDSGASMLTGSALNGLLIFVIVAALVLSGRVVYTAATTGLQLVRRIDATGDDNVRKGDLQLCGTGYVIPPPLSHLVALTVCCLVALLMYTVGLYLGALIGVKLGAAWSISCGNFTAADATLLCHRTPGECACGAITAVNIACVAMLCIGIYLWLQKLTASVVPREEDHDDQELRPLVH